MSSELHDAVDDLLARVERLVESLQESTDSSEALETIDELLDVAEEAEDLLETVDVSELLDAIDADDVSEVLELEDVPEAIEEGSPREAVELRKLLQLADLTALFDSADMRQVRREKRDLEEEIADLQEDDGEPADDDGLLGDGPEADGGSGATSGSFAGGATDAGAGDDVAGSDDGRRSAEVNQELLQQAMQSKIDAAVVEFRQGLLEAHEKLERLREENQERTGSQDTQPDSRNPTAYSSMTASRGDAGRGATYSTVPRETRHSSAPNRKRIYGDRFKAELEEEDDG